MSTKNNITVAWKTTYTGEIVMPIAFRYVPPHYVEYVKPAEKTEQCGAMRGVFTYVDADIIVMLEQTSLTRRRYATLHLCNTDRDLCHKLSKLAEAVWQKTGSPKLVVAKILETYGKSSLRPTTMSHPLETP